MNKKIILISLFAFFLLAGYLLWQKSNKPKAKIHYHAGFQLYLDGELQDFSKAKYMAIKPCSEKEEEAEENEQIEKAHLHDGVGDVVHVEADGARWKDLFVNIGYKIPAGKPLTGYVNGKKQPDILNYPINSYDSVVIFSGQPDEAKLPNSVKKEHIKQAEKKSESC